MQLEIMPPRSATPSGLARNSETERIGKKTGMVDLLILVLGFIMGGHLLSAIADARAVSGKSSLI